MEHLDLARSYLSKARVRLKALQLFYDEGAYSDVVREAQEAVEIALKGILWNIGVEPPKIHDVGRLVPSLEYGPEEADRAMRDARVVVEAAGLCIDPPSEA